MRHTFSAFPFLLLFALVTPIHTADHFNWQTVESGELKVHWYEGDLSFGQQALDTAQAGLQSIGGLFPVSLEQPVEIFIYASADDLHEALLPGEERWVAGHASPEQGVLRVLIEPGSGQEITMGQRIPHELMHVMLYRRVGAGYQMIPAWLREGMAILAEMHPNAEYDRVLKEAALGNTLIPLKDLCASFPDDTPRAFLAYAESLSFTSYLRETYGTDVLLTLATSYAGGVGCEDGTESVLGMPFSRLESQWRAAVFGEKTLPSRLQNISPYLVLLCLVLIIPMLGIAGTLRKGKRNESGTSLRE